MVQTFILNLHGHQVLGLESAQAFIQC